MIAMAILLSSAALGGRNFPGEYEVMHHAALRSGKPLVVFVCREDFTCEIPGCHVAHVETFPDIQQGIVVSVPRDGNLWYERVLPLWSTRIAIENEIHRMKEQHSQPKRSGNC